MSYIKPFLLTCIFLLGFVGFSQNTFESLGESELALNHKLSEDYSVNFSARSRYFLYKNEGFIFENRQIDVAHFSTLNIAHDKKISLGIQYRFRETFDGGSNELRLTQQFNFTKRKNTIRYGHRFRLEQRILDELTIWRSRYRFALDFPLNGEKLDLGEGYMITSTEILLSQSKTIKPEIDHRTSAFIGWLLSPKTKIQFGLEYRFETFNLNTEQKLFILSAFILKV